MRKNVLLITSVVFAGSLVLGAGTARAAFLCFRATARAMVAAVKTVAVARPSGVVAKRAANSAPYCSRPALFGGLRR